MDFSYGKQLRIFKLCMAQCGGVIYLFSNKLANKAHFSYKTNKRGKTTMLLLI
jgi:hypothetical protein